MPAPPDGPAPGSWRAHPAFAGVDLEDSRVLGWRLHGPPFRLVVSLDLCVVDGRDADAPRLPGERPAVARRPGAIVFEGVTEADGLAPLRWPPPPTGDAPPVIDTLAALRREDDGRWRFDLRWGEARIRCARVRLLRDDPPPGGGGGPAERDLPTSPR